MRKDTTPWGEPAAWSSLAVQKNSGSHAHLGFWGYSSGGCPENPVLKTSAAIKVLPGCWETDEKDHKEKLGKGKGKETVTRQEMSQGHLGMQ